MTHSSAPQRRRLALLAFAALAAAPLLVQLPASAAAQSEESLSYILMSAGQDHMTMSGSTDDLRRARALRNGREGLLYVRQNGTAYVIRDAETLRRAEALFAPQQELGARQARLGSQQAALGRRQAALGGQQARLGARQVGATPSQALALGRQQSELGRQQDVLGTEQNALGRQQEVLGREQERLHRQAQAGFRALLGDAIRRGIAQRL